MIDPIIQDIKINPESKVLIPTVLATLVAVEVEEVIGVVQVALESIRRYHRCTIIWNVPGAARETP